MVVPVANWVETPARKAAASPRRKRLIITSFINVSVNYLDQQEREAFQGEVPLAAIELIAILTLASASNTDTLLLPAGVLVHVEDRYWNTPEAVDEGFLANWL